MSDSTAKPLFFALTDIGLHREENQDNYGYFEGGPEHPLKGRLVVVADGMGGEQGGGVASSIAVKIILEHYKTTDGKPLMEIVKEAFEMANAEIYQKAQSNSGLKGMGTTCTAMIVLGDKGYLVHVGDTRAYRIRNEKIEQLTVDQTWVQDMVGRGMISEEESKVHPQRNVLTQALGGDSSINPVCSGEPLQLEQNDLYVFCTDGLSGLVSEEEILDLTVDETDMEQACASLVELAKARGGHDNITVLVLKIPA